MKKKVIWIGLLNIVIFTCLFVMTNTKVIGIVNQGHSYYLYVKQKAYRLSDQVVASRDSKYILGNIIATDKDYVDLKEGKVNNHDIDDLKKNKKTIEIYLKNGKQLAKNQYLVDYSINQKNFFLVVSKSELDGKIIL